MSAKIIDFSSKVKKNTQTKNNPSQPTTNSEGTLTLIHWMGFSIPPAINIHVNVKELDKLLLNNSDFDPPPRTA